MSTFLLNRSVKLGQDIAAGKAAKETLDASLEAINTTIKEVKTKYKKQELEKLFAGSVKTNDHKRAIYDAMCERGLNKKTASNYLSLIVNDCILGSKQFSYSMAKDKAKANKPEPVEPAVEVVEHPPVDAPKPSTGKILTQNQVKQVAKEPVNNGLDVRVPPNTSKQDFARAQIDGAIIAIQKASQALRDVNMFLNATLLEQTCLDALKAARDEIAQ